MGFVSWLRHRTSNGCLQGRTPHRPAPPRFRPRLDGGGIDNNGGALTVSGCATMFNSASVSGGGIDTTDGGTTDVSGSQVRYNSPDDTHTDPGSTLIVFNSIIGLET
jgi:hypothetical protein